MQLESEYFASLRAAIAGYGGVFNAHLHLDRAGTLQYAPPAAGAEGNALAGSQLSLAQKHAVIPYVHAGPAYDPGNLFRRVNGFIDRMISAGTTRACSVADVTLDRVGLSALEILLDIKRRRRHEIDFRVGAYSPLGFTDSEPGRWELLVQGAERADFIGSLPERDDCDDYPDHIGFDAHCRRMLVLGQRINRSLHIHVDQRNEPSEDGAERVMQAIREVGAPRSDSGEPMVWLIHVISPSTYEENRFDLLLRDLAAHNVGLICCPSAAISMRQIRPILTPTFNSIARVLDMLAAGIHVRLGSDNICDITSPAGTPDLIAEIFVLANAMRFYHVDILAKLAAGVRLSDADRQLIAQHLILDHEAAEVARQRSVKRRLACRTHTCLTPSTS